MPMTVREAAQLLEVSETTLYDLVAARALPHYRLGLGRGAIRLDREDVLAFKARRRVEAAGPPAPELRLKPKPAGLGLTMREFAAARKREGG